MGGKNKIFIEKNKANFLGFTGTSQKVGNTGQWETWIVNGKHEWQWETGLLLRENSKQILT